MQSMENWKDFFLLHPERELDQRLQRSQWTDK